MFKNIKSHHVMQGFIGLLLFVATIVIEAKSAAGAIEEHGGLDGKIWAAISVLFALLAVVAFGVAGFLKDDYREHVRRRAKAARILALVAMLVPASFLGSDMKADNMRDRREAYTAAGPNGGPSLYALDLEIADSPQSDVMDRREARWRIENNMGGATELSPVDAEFWAAVFFQLILLFGADALRIPAKITKEEYEHLKRSAAAKKAAITRRERQIARQKKAREEKRRPIFGLVVGGRK